MPTINPKARFLLDQPAAEAHRNLVARDNTHATIETALADLVVNRLPANDPLNAARIEGAKLFIHTWLNLASQAEPIKRLSDNLQS